MNRIITLYKKFGGVDLFREYMQTGFLFKAPFLLLYTGFSNKGLELFREAASFTTYKYLRRKYKKILVSNEQSMQSNLQCIRKVWIFWWQGMDCAPYLVQKCYQSICNQLYDWEIIVISRDNYKDFVSFPQFILDKLEAGKITLTHFSDLLRVELLIRYGGLWLDATVLCTDGNIPKVILESDLFVYQTQKPGANGHATVMSSWCIWARPRNRILCTTRSLLYAYWQKHDRLLDYFLLHHFFTLACEYHADEADRIPPYTNETPHLLLLHFFNTYQERLWEDWRRQSCFHKLSYKLPQADTIRKGTFYDKIINDGNGNPS